MHSWVKWIWKTGAFQNGKGLILHSFYETSCPLWTVYSDRSSLDQKYLKELISPTSDSTESAYISSTITQNLKAYFPQGIQEEVPIFFQQVIHLSVSARLNRKIFYVEDMVISMWPLPLSSSHLVMELFIQVIQVMVIQVISK